MILSRWGTILEPRAQVLGVNQPLFDPGNPLVGIAKTRKLLKMVWEVLFLLAKLVGDKVLQLDFKDIMSDFRTLSTILGVNQPPIGPR